MLPPWKRAGTSTSLAAKAARIGVTSGPSHPAPNGTGSRCTVYSCRLSESKKRAREKLKGWTRAKNSAHRPPPRIQRSPDRLAISRFTTPSHHHSAQNAVEAILGVRVTCMYLSAPTIRTGISIPLHSNVLGGKGLTDGGRSGHRESRLRRKGAAWLRMRGFVTK